MQLLHTIILDNIQYVHAHILEEVKMCVSWSFKVHTSPGFHKNNNCTVTFISECVHCLPLVKPKP